jgi:hypothetical protein
MLISKKHLDLFQPDKVELLLERVLTSLTSKEEKESKGTTVFLSHKHDETEILMKVVALFNSLGVKVYLDWQDDEMPETTSGETAEKLKTKIIENRKFILVATENAIASKWCNWELGFGDAKKYYQHIAVMPITEDDGTWKGNEYLQIYPILKTEYSIFKGDYFVEYKNQKTKLTDWLKT